MKSFIKLLPIILLVPTCATHGAQQSQQQSAENLEFAKQQEAKRKSQHAIQTEAKKIASRDTQLNNALRSTVSDDTTIGGKPIDIQALENLPAEIKEEIFKQFCAADAKPFEQGYQLIPALIPDAPYLYCKPIGARYVRNFTAQGSPVMRLGELQYKIKIHVEEATKSNDFVGGGTFDVENIINKKKAWPFRCDCAGRIENGKLYLVPGSIRSMLAQSSKNQIEYIRWLWTQKEAQPEGATININHQQASVHKSLPKPMRVNLERNYNLATPQKSILGKYIHYGFAPVAAYLMTRIARGN